jgi:hypothetical protein
MDPKPSSESDEVIRTMKMRSTLQSSSKVEEEKIPRESETFVRI